MNYPDNFDSYSAGAGLPAGWTDRWDAGTWSIIDDAGDKVLREASAGNNRYFASLDAINGDVNRDNVEILAKFRVSSLAPAGTTYGGLIIRGSGNGSSENGYGAQLVHAGGAHYFRINKYLAGAGSSVSGDSPASYAGNNLDVNEIWCMRLRVNGTSLSLAYWPDGAAPPGSPQISATDANITGAGWAGVFRFAGGFNFEWLDVAVATNGDTAAFGASGAALAGAANAAAAAPGALSTGIPLAGSAGAQAGGGGDLAGDVPLAGAGAAAASAPGDLATGIPLAGAASGQASASGVLAMTIAADYERSSVKLADSSIVGAGDAAIITIKPRLQASEVVGGEARWLEPSAKVTGVNGYRPTFRFSSYYTSGAGSYHGQPWQSTRRPMFSYDRETWTYFDTAVTVDGTNHWIEFRHSTAFTQDTVYISRSRQMSVEQVGAWIDSLAAAHPTIIEPTPSAAAFTPTLTGWSGQNFIADEFSAQTNELSEAIPATPLYAFRINDTSLMPAGGVAKRLAVVTAGVHAGEDHGNHVLKAFVDAVLGASAWGENLRRNYLIDIYPLINPPGRAGGGWRGSFTLGAGSIDDANRHFSDASPGLEIITKPRTAMATDRGSAAPDWFIDFHGTYVTGHEWSLTIAAAEPLHATAQSRMATYSGLTIADDGDPPAGSLCTYYYNTAGAVFAIHSETGDPTPVSDAQIATYADALVRTLDSMFVQLVGAATAAASASGSLAGGAAQLAGAGQDQAFAVADLTTAIQLASAAIAVPGASGTLIAGIPLDGAALSVSGAAAALTAQIRLAGAALGQAAAAAGFYDQAALQGAAAGSAAGTATLTVDILLHGTGAAAAAGPATLTTRIDLSAAALAQAASQGYLVQDIPLFGVALATAGGAGVLAGGAAPLRMSTRIGLATTFTTTVGHA